MSRKQKVKDIALVLPIGGVIVFLPPYIQVFDQDITLAGIPFLHFSLFALWLAGIFLTGIVAKKLISQPSIQGPKPGSEKKGYQTSEPETVEPILSPKPAKFDA